MKFLRIISLHRANKLNSLDDSQKKTKVKEKELVCLKNYKYNRVLFYTLLKITLKTIKTSLKQNIIYLIAPSDRNFSTNTNITTFTYTN